MTRFLVLVLIIAVATWIYLDASKRGLRPPMPLLLMFATLFLPVFVLPLYLGFILLKQFQTPKLPTETKLCPKCGFDAVITESKCPKCGNSLQM